MKNPSGWQSDKSVDDVLVSKIRRRDPLAFDELVRIHSPKMLGVASRILRSQNDAEDATQDALISAWRNIGQFDGGAAMTTWLHSITVNSSLAILKKLKKHAGNVELSEAEMMTSTQDFGVDDFKNQIWEAIDALPWSYRSVLILCEVEGRSNGEVAEAMNITEVTVRKRLSRARSKIAMRIAPELATQTSMSCGGTPALLWQFVHSELLGDMLGLVGGHINSCDRCMALATYGDRVPELPIPNSWNSKSKWAELGLKL